jgi:hypothetical protein
VVLHTGGLFGGFLLRRSCAPILDLIDQSATRVRWPPSRTLGRLGLVQFLEIPCPDHWLANLDRAAIQVDDGPRHGLVHPSSVQALISDGRDLTLQMRHLHPELSKQPARRPEFQDMELYKFGKQTIEARFYKTCKHRLTV